MYLCKNLSLGTFLGCSYFFTTSEADVLINSVLRQNTACMEKECQKNAMIPIPMMLDVMMMVQIEKRFCNISSAYFDEI